MSTDEKNMNASGNDMTQEEQRLLDILEKSRDSEDWVAALADEGDVGKVARRLWHAERVMASEAEDVDLESKLRRFHKRTIRKSVKLRWLAVAAVVLACFLCTALFFSRNDDDGLGDTRTVMAIRMPENTTLLVRDGDKWKPLRTVTKEGENFKAEGKDYRTFSVLVPYGKTTNVKLADGTSVLLSPGSRLVFPSLFKGSKRMVELKGEAYFEVRHDKDHPFVVRTAMMETQVLGTKFCVSADLNRTPMVTLVDGKVMVKSKESGQEVILTKGMRATFDNGRFTLSQVSVDQYAYRKMGMFYFDNATLEDIMDEIGRWYGMKVYIRSKAIRSTCFHFTAGQGSIDQVIEQLNSLEEFTVRKSGNTLVVI
jgi:transmembrane sensor